MAFFGAISDKTSNLENRNWINAGSSPVSIIYLKGYLKLKIKDILKKCSNLIDENQILKKISYYLKQDTINFSKLIDLPIYTQKSLFDKVKMCNLTSLYTSFNKYIILNPKDFVKKATELNNVMNINEGIKFVEKYSDNLKLNSYGYNQEKFGDKQVLLEIIQKSINNNESCVLHIECDISNTSHNISIYGYDRNKYLYFIENAFKKVTLKALSVKYAICEIVKFKNGLGRYNKELIESLPENYENMSAYEFYRYSEKYLLTKSNSAKQKILSDIILNCADTVCVIFNDKIGNYKQNFVYMSAIADGKFENTNIKIKDLI